MRAVFFAAIGSVCFTVLAVAQDGFAPVTIAYDDYEKLLLETVIDMGRSDRIPAEWVDPPTSSRIYRGSRNPTRLEANRLLYDSFTDGTIQAIRAIRKSLETVPGEIDFEQLHPNERLAFWLNLHNLAVIEAVGEHYPVQRLDQLLPDILSEKYLSINGQVWSIAEIERHVIQNWDDPRVIYGFYRGHIGSPNIRHQAFEADSVWDDLEDNAKDFIGSLRGVQFDGEKMRISEFYQEMSDAFLNSDQAFKDHLAQYATPLMIPKIYNSTKITADVNDWTIADIYGGVKGHHYGTWVRTSIAAASDTSSYVGYRGRFLPPQMVALLKGLGKRHERQKKRRATVIIQQESAGTISNTNEESPH